MILLMMFLYLNRLFVCGSVSSGCAREKRQLDLSYGALEPQHTTVLTYLLLT